MRRSHRWFCFDSGGLCEARRMGWNSPRAGRWHQALAGSARSAYRTGALAGSPEPIRFRGRSWKRDAADMRSAHLGEPFRKCWPNGLCWWLEHQQCPLRMALYFFFQMIGAGSGEMILRAGIVVIAVSEPCRGASCVAGRSRTCGAGHVCRRMAVLSLAAQFPWYAAWFLPLAAASGAWVLLSGRSIAGLLPVLPARSDRFA